MIPATRRLGGILKPAWLVGMAVGTAWACALPLRAQAPLPDPFAGVQVQQLGNGLTVWFKRFPGAGTTSISLSVPSGSDRDPAGREELAHVVEHALFAARDGVTQEQLASAVVDRGGSFNAATSPDRTLLWVNVAREHSGFALEWLHGLLAPRAWGDSILPAVREAVALELGLAPRSLPGRIRDEFVLRRSLQPPGFWEREFGLSVPEYRPVDRYQSLQRIRAADLNEFYRAHYVPARMLLVVAGDLDATAVFRLADATFGQLPAWPASPPPPAYRLKRDPTRRFFWNLREDAAITVGFRLGSMSGADHVRLIFAQQLLERRLLRRLRWGSEQAVYGLRTAIVRRGGATLLQLDARTTPADLAQARSVIEDELARLRQGRYPANEFVQDRDALERALRVNQATPGALRAWHAAAFYHPQLHRTPPPLATHFSTFTPEELAAFARRALGPDRQLLAIERPFPFGAPGAAFLALVAVLLGRRAARRLLLRPVPIRELRYLARIRPPLPIRALGGVVFVAAVLLAGRLAAAGLHALADAVIIPRESFLLQALFAAAAIAVATFLGVACLSLVPHRVLVFDHELRIKYLAFRTTAIPAAQLRAIGLASFRDVWLHRRLWRTVPLALGWRRPGLLLQRSGGCDWFLATRDPTELAEVLGRLQPAAALPAATSPARHLQAAS